MPGGDGGRLCGNLRSGRRSGWLSVSQLIQCHMPCVRSDGRNHRCRCRRRRVCAPGRRPGLARLRAHSLREPREGRAAAAEDCSATSGRTGLGVRCGNCCGALRSFSRVHIVTQRGARRAAAIATLHRHFARSCGRSSPFSVRGTALALSSRVMDRAFAVVHASIGAGLASALALRRCRRRSLRAPHFQRLPLNRQRAIRRHLTPPGCGGALRRTHGPHGRRDQPHRRPRRAAAQRAQQLRPANNVACARHRPGPCKSSRHPSRGRPCARTRAGSHTRSVVSQHPASTSSHPMRALCRQHTVPGRRRHRKA